VNAADVRNPEERARRKRHADFTFGLVLIVFGVLLLAQRINILPDVDFHRLWPMVLVVIGLAQLIMPREDRKRSSGLTLLFIGGIFLMHTYDVLSLRDSWPLFIAVGGLSLIMGRRS